MILVFIIQTVHFYSINPCIVFCGISRPILITNVKIDHAFILKIEDKIQNGRQAPNLCKKWRKSSLPLNLPILTTYTYIEFFHNCKTNNNNKSKNWSHNHIQDGSWNSTWPPCYNWMLEIRIIKFNIKTVNSYYINLCIILLTISGPIIIT